VEPERLISELLGVARKLKLRVRIEPLDFPATTGGGLCTVDGERFAILDAGASTLERASALANILATLDHESVYVTPVARDFIYARASRNR
jgi:hypothetical protein